MTDIQTGTTGLRFGTIEGKRYVAHDTLLRGPEHAIWKDEKVLWIAHTEGTEMEPFEGPDEVYEQLTEGGLHLWDS